MTSGKIVACDGLIPSTDPFLETREPGSYPVILSLVRDSGAWPTVACVMLRFQDEMPTVWKLATIAGQNPTIAIEGDIVGYGVDCGVACCADLDVMQTLITSSDLYHELQRRVHQSNVKWVDFYVGKNTHANIIVFSSGYGDGTYPSCYGYNAQGDVLCLATDFGVIASLTERPIEKPSKDQLRFDL